MFPGREDASNSNREHVDRARGLYLKALTSTNSSDSYKDSEERTEGRPAATRRRGDSAAQRDDPTRQRTHAPRETDPRPARRSSGVVPALIVG